MNPDKLKQLIDEKDQRKFIFFGLSLGWSMPEIHRSLKKVLGGQAYELKNVEYWAGQFKKGREDFEDHRGGACHQAEDKDDRVALVQAKMNESRAWSMSSLAQEVGLPKATVHRIVTQNLKMSKKLMKWVPHDLTEVQRGARIQACRDNLRKYRHNRRLLNRTLAIDESWVGLYTQPKQHKKRVWLKEGEEPPSMPHEELRGKKRMLIMALDWNGVAFWKLLPEKTTVTAEVYRDFLEENVREWMAKNGQTSAIIAHDNARPHLARIVREWMDLNEIDTWVQPAYSPDVQPLDYNCFGTLKYRLSGIRFADFSSLEQEIQKICDDALFEDIFQGVRDMPDRWEKVIEAEGDYI